MVSVYLLWGLRVTFSQNRRPFPVDYGEEWLFGTQDSSRKRIVALKACSDSEMVCDRPCWANFCREVYQHSGL